MVFDDAGRKPVALAADGTQDRPLRDSQDSLITITFRSSCRKSELAIITKVYQSTLTRGDRRLARSGHHHLLPVDHGFD